MDPDSTTTIGEGESLTTESPFQSMKAVDSTSAKFSTCAASCRGCMPATPSMAAICVVTKVSLGIAMRLGDASGVATGVDVDVDEYRAIA
jgi:hypothetical protein